MRPPLRPLSEGAVLPAGAVAAGPSGSASWPGDRLPGTEERDSAGFGQADDTFR